MTSKVRLITSDGAILKQMTKMKVSKYLQMLISEYLSERMVNYGPATKELKRGTPQGSVFGPLLWNMYRVSII